MSTPDIGKHDWTTCLTSNEEALMEYLHNESEIFMRHCVTNGILQQTNLLSVQKAAPKDKVKEAYKLLRLISKSQYLDLLKSLQVFNPDLSNKLADSLGVKDFFIPQAKETNSKKGMSSTDLAAVHAPSKQKKKKKKEDTLVLEWVSCTEDQTLKAQEQPKRDEITQPTMESLQKVLLKKKNVKHYSGKPSVFVNIIRKVEVLIEDELYVSLVKEMSALHAKHQEKQKEDPLQCLVELLDRGPSLTMVKNCQNLYEVMKILLKSDHSSNTTRSRCIRTLMECTEEGRLCQDQKEQETIAFEWDDNFIEVLELLIDNGADPKWSPEEEYMLVSNLHVFCRLLPCILPCEHQVFERLLKLLDKMTCKPVDLENCRDKFGQTALHCFVDTICKWPKHKSVQQLIQIIDLFQKKSKELLDCTAHSGKTALHTFVNGICKNKFNEDILEFLKKIVGYLKTETNINIQSDDGSTLLHLLVKNISPELTTGAKEQCCEIISSVQSKSNLDSTDKDNKTALHLWMDSEKKWGNDLNFVFEVTKALTSAHNINMEDKTGKTALHCWMERGDRWGNDSDFFLEVAKILKSPRNIAMKDNKGNTPLHLLTSATSFCLESPDTFMKAVQIIRTKNVDEVNEQGQTPLHVFVLRDAKWRNSSQKFIEIIKVLKPVKNANSQDDDSSTLLHWLVKEFPPELIIDIYNIISNFKSTPGLNRGDKVMKTTFKFNLNSSDLDGKTALHCWMEREDRWGNDPEIFVKVTKILTSGNNIDMVDNKRKTPLHCFIAGTKQFLKNKGAAKYFCDTVDLLKSSSNVDIQDADGNTPLHIFVQTAPYPDLLSKRPILVTKCVNCLKSCKNIEMKNDKREKACQIFAKYENAWSEQHSVFLEIVELLSATAKADHTIVKYHMQDDNNEVPRSCCWCCRETPKEYRKISTNESSNSK